MNLKNLLKIGSSFQNFISICNVIDTALTVLIHEQSKAPKCIIYINATSLLKRTLQLERAPVETSNLQLYLHI